jgi:transposase InsO family protein
MNQMLSKTRWLFVRNWDKAKSLLPPIKLLDEYERWRRVAKILGISKEGKLRLEWIIYNRGGHSVAQTTRHFGISRKTFYKWNNEFEDDNLYSLKRLEDKSKAPNRVRQRDIAPEEEQRIVKIRKSRMNYGKMKIRKIYKDRYGEVISSWKIQKTIEKYKLYRNPNKTAKIAKKRARVQKKKRITELELNKLKPYQKRAGYIICLDTIVIHRDGLKRYILTAIDKFSKVAYARMYKSKSTLSSEDFLARLYILMDGKIPRVGHDNGTEFEKYFRKACKKLKIEQYYSRVRTPKDNPQNERFNRTLQEEFIQNGNFSTNTTIFNKKLTQWLIEYNFHRPHASLNYKSPIQFSNVLPMYSSYSWFQDSIARLIFLPVIN